jgi:thioredoxin 1
MGLARDYESKEPTRAEVDGMAGPLVLEFGTPWCGWCRGAQPHIAAAFEGHEKIRHIKIEDGSGRRLGRTFRVKLWPTLVFMKDGAVVETLVRPSDTSSIRSALGKIE